MIQVCRIFPHAPAEGAWNMALDEALLDFVAEDPSCAVLRTYRWIRPTLSLGYFQSIQEAESDPRWADVTMVRRPTGGGALWHDLEVTYAVVIPGDHPAARPSRELYRTIHSAISAQLRSSGVVADRRGNLGEPGVVEPSPFLCFADRDQDDVVVDDIKLVGSAQRRRSGAVLQHGSVLLGRSQKTPELAGLVDLASIPADPIEWGAVLEGLLPGALGLTPVIEELPDGVRRRAGMLARDVYGNPSWTRRR